MRVFITGEKGFIGTNLIERAKQFKDIEIVTRDNGNYDQYFIHFKKEGSEPCVHKNKQFSWETFFEDEKIPMSTMIQDLLMFYKYGGKQLYYFNTFDGQGEIDINKLEDLPQEQIDDADCDSCVL